MKFIGCFSVCDKMKKRIFVLIALWLVLILSIHKIHAQGNDKATVIGTVTDAVDGQKVDFTTIYIQDLNLVAESNSKGYYELVIPAQRECTLIFTRLGYKDVKRKISGLSPNAKLKIDVALVPEDSDIEVVVTESKIEDVGMIREDVKALKLLPTTSGNFESILPHLALGVSSGTGGELSSQYNVRGGNYDENLVYVNDFEIFRPQLIRSSQQEGLSFPNVDLIRDLSFSSGGFESKYGDKMSSVLDIRYKRPEEFKGSVGMSFLGASAHIEGSKQIGKGEFKKLRYLVGARYKTSKYLLGSLDVQGEYAPNFTDIQSYITYDISTDLQLGFIGNYNSSNFSFIPKERGTALGLIDFALKLSTVFEGRESDDFTNGMTGLSLTYLPDRKSNPLFLKLMASNYLGREREAFDILGYYRLSQIETDFGSENAGQEVAILGTGVQHTYARNVLYSRITNVEHRGGIELQQEYDNDYTTSSHFLQWGVKWQHEDFDDRLNEWERLDSAGYSLPYDENAVRLSSVLKSQNNIQSDRISAFFQNSYSFRNDEKREIKINAGIRSTYYSLNQETNISPRVQILYKPLGSDKDFSFKLATGIYYQPPFYRELRRIDGTLNLDLKSQKSVHYLAGMTYDFLLEDVSSKKFKLITEIYHKKLSNLETYELDNVRIRYSGDNNATGYINGLDLRVNGEFVPGAESWINLSFLTARERINGVQHLSIAAGDSTARAVDYVPRPTDQLFTISVFFQDYLPKNENFKMHLNLIYGSGLPFGVKDNNEVYRNVYNYTPYRRVDIGFSWLLWNDKWKDKKPNHPLGFADNVWMSLEVFNLLAVENVASNTWIKDILNRQYAIPNNLTSRRINLRLKVDF